MKSKTSSLLYSGTFTLTKALIAFLEYLLVAYCRWSEQRWGSGHRGTGPQDRKTKDTGRAQAKAKEPRQKAKKRSTLLKEKEAELTHQGPKSWWADGAQPCVVHYHTQQAASTTPPTTGRRIPPCWLPQNLVRMALETKAPALMGGGYWKGHRSMPA